MNDEEQTGLEQKSAKQPSTFQKKFVKFYFVKGQLKRKLWFASKAHPYSPHAQDLCEQLFLSPLRAGNYKHFRIIAAAIKTMDKDGDLDADRSPGAKENEEEIEHYVFSAARYCLDHPPVLEVRWTKLEAFRRAVAELALKYWAAVKLRGKYGQQLDVFNLSDVEKNDIQAMISTRGEKDNWSRVWKNTGIMGDILS
jgi:hypothetical protein